MRRFRCRWSKKTDNTAPAVRMSPAHRQHAVYFARADRQLISQVSSSSRATSSASSLEPRTKPQATSRRSQWKQCHERGKRNALAIAQPSSSTKPLYASIATRAAKPSFHQASTLPRNSLDRWDIQDCIKEKTGANNRKEQAGLRPQSQDDRRQRYLQASSAAGRFGPWLVARRSASS